jgi:hypothetical protein
MKKVKLQIHDLTVESFPTNKADGEHGTVEGQEVKPTPPYVGCVGLTRLTYDCPCTPAY